MQMRHPLCMSMAFSVDEYAYGIEDCRNDGMPFKWMNEFCYFG